jgi:crotonobetainyl-CoA:carnitine CoA-transferase CaiB-like acyl-CoA transferase
MNRGVAPDRSGPLAGIRVLDVSQYIAGPVATRILADLGAEVIKVESPHRMDPIRAAAPHLPQPVRPPTGRGRPTDIYDIGPLFNYLNRGKLGLGLDYRDPRARPVLHALVRQSQVFVENFGVGVAEHYGLGWQDLSAVNPRLCMLAMPFYGNAGPRSDWVGFGQSTESASGITWLTGYHRDIPRVQGGVAYGDPSAGVYGALGAIAALNLIRADGRGRYVDLSHVESVAVQIGLEVESARNTGWEPPRITGLPSGGPPWQAMLRCAGPDDWVSVTLWENPDCLRPLLGMDGESNGSGPAELFDGLHRWAAARTAGEVLARLRGLGARAVKAMSAPDLLADARLRARDMITALDHPVAGMCRHPGFPALVDGAPLDLRRAGPCFGEHNRLILQDLLGMTADEVQALLDAGILAEEPAVPMLGGAVR